MKNEDAATSFIEDRTRRIPSVSFLGLAIGSMAASLTLMLLGRGRAATFIGQWAPTLLILGTYNKITKTFSAPYDEDQRLHHGDNEVPRRMEGDYPVTRPSGRPMPT